MISGGAAEHAEADKDSGECDATGDGFLGEAEVDTGHQGLIDPIIGAVDQGEAEHRGPA